LVFKNQGKKSPNKKAWFS
jgi:hypothetical protein